LYSVLIGTTCTECSMHVGICIPFTLGFLSTVNPPSVGPFVPMRLGLLAIGNPLAPEKILSSSLRHANLTETSKKILCIKIITVFLVFSC
jgi:hypothetical protein